MGRETDSPVRAARPSKTGIISWGKEHTTPRRLGLWLVFLLVGLNLGAQMLFLRPGLDNQPTNAYCPACVDSFEYLHRADLILKGDFITAFRDGYRLPGYPLFLALLMTWSEQPLLTARLVQVALSAGSILVSYLTLGALGIPRPGALAGTALIAAWWPLYYWSPLLYAESLSLFLFAASIYSLVRLNAEPRSRWTFVLPLFLALLVYLKPNHLLLTLPFGLVLGYQARGAQRWVLVHSGELLIALLIPWLAFSAATNGRLMPLSTTSGVNLFLGSGVAANPENPDELGNLYITAAQHLGVSDLNFTNQVKLELGTLFRPQYNQTLTVLAYKLWRQMPLERSLYGLSKVLHAFGFSLRSLRDGILAAFSLVSLGAMGYLWRSGKQRRWVLFFVGITAITAMQAFIYLPNQRFKTLSFDLPAILILSLALAEIFPLTVHSMRNRFFHPAKP